jgi:uncharacterized Zn-binding protein involved in type VI secretion
MPGIVRKGDKNSAGGAALLGQSNFKVNNKQSVVNGASVAKHKPCPIIKIHCSAKTKGGVGSFLINNIPANVIGNSDSCGHSRTGGSKDFIIGN